MSHRRDRWFTITQRVLSNNQVKRIYIVICCKCGRQGEQHAGMVTEDMRRKAFQRLGWELGRWKNLHVCPSCAGNAPPPVAEVEEPEPALPELTTPKSWIDELPRLQAAWSLSYEDEHLAFIEWLRVTYGDRYVPAPASAPAPAPTPTLTELWELASDNERVLFWQHLQSKQGREHPLGPPPPIEQVEVETFVARGVAAQAAVDALTEVAPSDDEGAEDWYVELMKKQKKKRARK